jgi:hypothetical protein
MHKKRAIFVKQATIGTVFTVKFAKCHILVSPSGNFLKKMDLGYRFSQSKVTWGITKNDNLKSEQFTKK